jgi:hypothetical protein
MGIFDIALTISAIVGIALVAFILFRKTTFTTVTIKITNPNPLYSDTNPPSWYAFAFRAGDKELDSTGQVQVEILDTSAYPSYGNKKIVFLKLRVRAVYSGSKKQFTYKGKPLIVGSELHVELTNQLIDGVITEIENMPSPYQNKYITLKADLLEYNPVFQETDGVDEFKANAIHVGDAMKDNNGTMLATVLDKSVIPADRYITSQGFVTIVPDPKKKHVTLTLKIRVQEWHGDQLFLYTFPVKVGEELPLNLPNVSIAPIITDLLGTE